MTVDVFDPEQPYERVIGLGNCCISRFQINHHYQHRFGVDSNAFGGGQLFDWLIIQDYHKVAATLILITLAYLGYVKFEQIYLYDYFTLIILSAAIFTTSYQIYARLI